MHPDAGSDNDPAPRKRKERTKDGRLRKRTAIFVFSAVGSGNGFSERAGRTAGRLPVGCPRPRRGRPAALCPDSGPRAGFAHGDEGRTVCGRDFSRRRVRACRRDGGRGQADGQRAGIAKEGRSASRRPERSVAENLPCEARNRTGENEVGKGPPFRGAAFCCRCLLRRSCRFATSGRRIGYRRFSAGILSSHEEIPTRARPFAGARFVVAAWRRRRTPSAGSGEHVFGA